MNPATAFGRALVRAVWLARSGRKFRDNGPTRKPRLLIDISVIRRHDAKTGIQRVVRGVLSALMKLGDKHFDVVPVYATGSHGYCFAIDDHLAPPTPVGVRRGDLFLGLDLAAHLLPTYRRQVGEWRRAGASIHVVVYDLLPLRCPQWFNERTARHFSRWWRFITDQADQLLCISDHVAAEVRDYVEREGKSVAVGRLHLAGNIAATSPSTGLSEADNRVAAWLGERPFILMVGTVEPRKAYDVALAAFEQLWRDSPQDSPDLVVVGKPGWKTEVVQQRLRHHPNFPARVHWFPSASDELLQQLYDRCVGMFLASHAEGFGLPASEAAMHGAPILVRDLPVFREQQLPATLYFVDQRPAALARDLAQLARTPRYEPLAGGLTWEDCASSLLRELELSTFP